MKEIRSYIDWEPFMSPEDVFSDIIGISEIKVDGSETYWLELRPFEKGRSVVVWKDSKGKIYDITPKDFNVRTRVHEYGGGSYTVFDGNIYFSNFKDQRLYHQRVGSSIVRPLTPERNKDGSLGKYSSFTISPCGRFIIFIYEKEFDDKENENFIGLIDLSKGELSEPTIIAKGCDFYADPIFSPDCKKVAWIQWNHPNMPWDSTELMIADFNENGLKNIQRVDGGEGISVCLPKFNSIGELFYVKDYARRNENSPENWWNIYCYSNGKIEEITSEYAEFGLPQWVFGRSTYDFLPDGRIVANMPSEKGGLILIDPADKSWFKLGTTFCDYSYLKVGSGSKVYFIGSKEDEVKALYLLEIATGELKLIKKSSRVKIDPENISIPKKLDYSTSDGNISHAYFYEPKNKLFKAPEEEKPPLLVVAHGGPTANTSDSFSFIIQFWTSAGFAVVDVDYRGSTGYGRKYRDALLGKWGIIDTADVADAVKYLIRQGKIDGSKVAIRGGSAGGYMVQRAMTEYPELFSVGASYFGIGNLITLVKGTHKFESKYIDNLVGAKLPEGELVYKERSPIFHLDKLKSPMIIFQGSEDKIVTPDCSREMAEILKQKGIKYEYVEYEGEAHGFRTKENNVDSLKRELNFYREVFKCGDQ